MIESLALDWQNHLEKIFDVAMPVCASPVGIGNM